MQMIKSDILSYFPMDLGVDESVLAFTEEIRVRLGQPIIFRIGKTEVSSKVIANEKLILNLLEKFSDNSIYAFQSEINSGFITIQGGHRVRNFGDLCH